MVGLVAVLVAVLAVFGTVQWRSAVDAKRDVEDLLAVDDLVSASREELADDPELALLLAMQAVRETVDLGFATEEAVDALHFALQNLGIQYDVDAGTPVAVRPGPDGPVGVYALPPGELMAFAASSVQRTLTDAECRAVLSDTCPADIDVPERLPLQDGMGSYGATATGPNALAGTTVRFSAGALSEDQAFALQLAAFADRTGITVEFMRDEAQAPLDSALDERNRRPDVVEATSVPAWAASRALDVSRFIDPAVLRSDFGALLLSTRTPALRGGELPPGAPVSAIPLRMGLKGLVFYPKAEFDEAGYEIPTTWAELVELSHQIADDGGTPWCFGFASGYADGWPGTDFIESLVLRTGGVEAYDAWTAGEIGFTSPSVMAAGRLADELIFEPGFVLGGPDTIGEKLYYQPLIDMVERDEVTGETGAGCWLVHGGTGTLHGVQAEGAIGSDIDFFPLPPIDPTQPTPAIGEVSFATAVVDTPEVRAFMSYVADPEWGEIWATDSYSGFVSANRRFDMSAYGPVGEPGADPSPNAQIAFNTKIASVGHATLESGVLRLDASDLMPAEIGFGIDGVVTGAFWRGMMRLGRWSPLDRAGLRRHRCRVGRAEGGRRDVIVANRPARSPTHVVPTRAPTTTTSVSWVFITTPSPADGRPADRARHDRRGPA